MTSKLGTTEVLTINGACIEGGVNNRTFFELPILTVSYALVTNPFSSVNKILLLIL